MPNNKRILYNIGINVKKLSEYHSWRNMVKRCYNVNDISYPNYGARGIKVCDRWRKNFKFFLEDMGYKPSKHHTLDRIDNSKDYSKENCRWATKSEQNRNQRTNVWVEYNGEKIILMDFALKINANYFLVNGMYHRGRPIEYIANHFTKKQIL